MSNKDYKKYHRPQPVEPVVQEDILEEPVEEISEEEPLEIPTRYKISRCLSLNIRKKPTKDSGVAAVAKKEDILVLDSEISGEWVSVFIESRPEISGYVMSSFIVPV